jgi:hypothetical protein
MGNPWEIHRKYMAYGKYVENLGNRMGYSILNYNEV